MSGYEVTKYLDQGFFRCITSFLSWLEVGQTYWFEYHGNEEFEVRSDNNLGKVFNMSIHQLLTCFYPVKCEANLKAALMHFHWLGERGIHSGCVSDIAAFIHGKVNEMETIVPYEYVGETEKHESRFIISSWQRQAYDTDDKIREFLEKSKDDLHVMEVTVEGELWSKKHDHPNSVVSYPDEFVVLESLHSDAKLKKYTYYRDGWGCVYENIICYEIL